MASLLLGVAVGFFMSAYVNHKYNTSQWIDTKYLVWIGVAALVISAILGWPEIENGFLEGG